MDAKGFTLIELIIVIVILAVIGFITVNIIYNATDAWQFIKLRKEIAQDARVAMERLIRQIRVVQNSSSVRTADSRTFSFIEERFGLTVTFSWSGNPGDSLLQNANVLAENVTNFNLEYRDINDVVLNPPTLSPNTNIWRIIINLTLLKEGQSISFVSEVHPMNF